MGIKSFVRLNGQVHFLEIWNVPTKELHTLSVEINLPHATAVLLAFDGCEGDRVRQQQSFSDMQDVYIDAIDWLPANKFVVCINHILKPMTHAVRRDSLVMSRSFMNNTLLDGE